MGTLKHIKDFPIGTKTEMTVVDPIEGKINIGFVSQLESIIDANMIRISAPIFEAKVYPVRVNSRIEAYLFYKSNQLYRIAGIVTDRLIIDDIALLELRVIEQPEKIQRRQFYRFDCNVPVTFFEPGMDEQEEDGKITGHTVDISGGGLSSVTNKMLDPDTNVKGILKLEDYHFEFTGKVIRSQKNIINDEIKYVTSIGFIDIEYSEREKIVAFIFNQQRELLRKGLRGNE